MPGFGDTTFIVLLALLLFGPKKLPVLARQLGKLMADFRRASNEFRSQMEEELRISEQAERQKQVAAIEAAAPATPAIDPIPEPEHPHLPPPAPSFVSDTAPDYGSETWSQDDNAREYPGEQAAESTPVPIATSGELSILPPATGLPVPNNAAPTQDNLFPPEPEPAAEPPLPSHDAAPSHQNELETESLHG